MNWSRFRLRRSGDTALFVPVVFDLIVDVEFFDARIIKGQVAGADKDIDAEGKFGRIDIVTQERLDEIWRGIGIRVENGDEARVFIVLTARY